MSHHPHSKPFRPWGHEDTLKAAKHYFVGTENLPETGDILPEQFHDRSQDHRVLGEKGLMLAVLEDAIRCYQKHAHSTGPRGMRLFEETCVWMSEGASDWPYSFENICSELDIDTNRLCLALVRWRDSNQAPTPTLRRKCHSKGRSHGGKHAPSRDRTCHA
jgi:hypothetical protein